MAISQTETHFSRYRQIAEVLARHGLGYLVSVLGLDQFRPFQQGLLAHPQRASHYTRPEYVRMALEEMGATFIKLGQVLSTRADLLPPDYLTELAKLQDAAPPVPSELVQERIVAELGQPIETVFTAFDPAPLAAASLGQAHAAVLPCGTDVIIKVRRPGVVEQVGEDLEILQNLAAAASRHWEFAGRYDLVGLVQEFAETLRAELDYLREGQNAERFTASFAGDPAVHIPRVFWETTTSRVLTLERVRGLKVSDLSALDAQGIDRRALAERAAHVILKMIFEDGFFHADPHPGNFFIEPGGRIGLIDFGMVGAVDERVQERLSSLIIAITSRDDDRLVDALLELGLTRGRVNREQLRRDVSHLMSRYWGRPLGELAIGALLADAFAVIRTHQMHLPSNLALMLKAAVMVEGLGAQLDPSFRLTVALAPYAERLVVRQYSLWPWIRRLGPASLDLAELGIEMPQQLRRIMGDIERGGFEVGVRPEGFQPLLSRFERLANRIVLGVIAAAFINGLAVLASVYRPPGWERWAWAVFAFGFLCALVLGIYLAWSINRFGRG